MISWYKFWYDLPINLLLGLLLLITGFLVWALFNGGI